MKRHVKIAISTCVYALGWPSSFLADLLRREVRSRLVVLYYHGVPDDARAGFARQLDMLVRRAGVVRADWRGRDSRRLLCAITFDDALQSVLSNALPELAKRQLPCTIFVPTGIMGRPPNWVMESDDAVSGIVASAEDIKSLPNSLVTIAAHTVSHPFLSRIPLDAARTEIERSRSTLSELTGQPVRMMSFPYGDYDEDVTTVCKEAGYELVFSIKPHPVDPLSNAFIRGRVVVDPTDGPLEFFLKMTGSYRWMTAASRLIRVLSGIPALIRSPVFATTERRRLGA